MKEQKVYLTLQNGRVFEGKRFGAKKDITGELVFNTSAVGYIDTLTEPAYFGQIVIQTFPLVGNYGVILKGRENVQPKLSALVVREYCEAPSNFRCEETLNDYMVRNNIVGVYGIDTRELTKTVREAGVMNAVISSRPVQDLSEVQKFSIKNAVMECTVKEVKVYGNENAKRNIVLWDFGAREYTVPALVERDNKVIRVPANYTAEQIMEYNPDAIVLSDGGGNPAENIEIIKNIKKIAGKVPVFATGLGHQMFALAMGGQTAKMKYGHRGSNQPVKDLKNGNVYISGQNHGYVVVPESMHGVAEVSFINVNDGTCEGLNYPELKAFTVQFNPEACACPSQENDLYDKFMTVIDGGKTNA